jgi:hypothetical protein
VSVDYMILSLRVRLCMLPGTKALASPTSYTKECKHNLVAGHEAVAAWLRYSVEGRQSYLIKSLCSTTREVTGPKRGLRTQKGNHCQVG